MIAALVLAFQLAAAAPSPSAIVVRNATRSVSVPLVAGETGPLLRADALAPIIPVKVAPPASGSWTVTIGDVALRLEPGIPAVRVDDDVHQLAAPPEVRDGKLYLPLSFVSDILPQLVPNVRWDAENLRLVAFSKIGAEHASVPPARDGGPRAGGDDPGPRVARKASSHDRRTIVVDAGHGGPDNGMKGPLGGEPKLFEKNITLAVSRRLGTLLEQRGVDVVYTRTTDTLIALSDRGRIANRAQGDLFISIHVNAANPNWRDPGGARGFETYFLSEARTEDARRVERMENESVRYEDAPNAGKDDPLNFILSDMMQNEHLRESSELAELIQRRLGRMHPGPSRGVKQAGFRVLVTAYMPAVLVEIGFGTNPAEAEFLASPAKQQAIATAIADAAMEYLERYERRVGGTW